MYKFSFIILLLISISLKGQLKLDSLKTVLSKQKDDTNKVNTLHKLIKESDPQQGVEYALAANKLSQRLGYKLVRNYIDLSDQYDLLSNYKQAIYYNQLALKEAMKLQYPAKEYYLSRICTTLGLIDEKMGNYQGAIHAESDAIKYSKVLNDEKGINISHFNLGNYQSKLLYFDKALEEYEQAEKGFIKTGDSIYLPYVYNSKGNVFSQRKEYDKALSYFQKSYDLTLLYTPDDITSLAISMQNIGEMLGKLGNPDLGIVKCLKSAEMFDSVSELNHLCMAYYNVADLYAIKGDYRKSNDYFKMYVALKDSVFTEDTKNTIHEMSIKYETEKKEQENKILAKDNEKQQMTIYYTCGGLLLMAGLVFSVYKSNRLKTKANKQLAYKNEIIHQQKQLVEEKQTEILDSISYAKRLQEAILPPLNLLQESFKDIFVYYQPKDIVAGDFYWCEVIENAGCEYIFIAAADCTGHGVPGALVSVVCSNALNRAAHEYNLTEPGQILNKTRELVVKTFAKSEKNVKDGMDISLVSIKRSKNSALEITWAGANNPVYILSGGSIKEIKGDKFPVGAYIDDEPRHFKTHELSLQPSDRIYIFSDGLPDQFGGPDNKKYKYKRLKEQLLNSCNLPLKEQKDFIRNDLKSWQGTNEQVDDILIIGFEV
ncbi:MAG: SpoIIE family protein phosphatase [Bacteroidetes bacterium]|nr:SpoIIE family protein phosphatase [Bacteroidota bacterium]